MTNKIQIIKKIKYYYNNRLYKVCNNKTKKQYNQIMKFQKKITKLNNYYFKNNKQLKIQKNNQKT